MRHPLSTLLVVSAICASATLALSQVAPSSTKSAANSSATSAPVALVYVASYSANGTSKLFGFAVAPNGVLTPAPGSPRSLSGPGRTSGALALNGKWLFAIDGNNIDSFEMGPHGWTKKVHSYALDPSLGYPSNLFLDHTGATLYVSQDNSDNVGYDSLKIDQSTGQLTSINFNGVSAEWGSALSFIGNNKFAYSSSCFRFTPSIFGFKRNSDGSLSALADNPALPSSPANTSYCPYLAAADPTNHVAVLMGQDIGPDNTPGSVQLATYTADKYGNLTTTSTYENMPVTQVGGSDLAMSPRGTYLAVTGQNGLQIFHFHGSQRITKWSGVHLAGTNVIQAFWDNSSHLYAISYTANKLYVFNIAPNRVSQAAGSPYNIPDPYSLIVLPKAKLTR